MSKRLATYVTLSELVEEVGVDAARYFFVMRKTDSHLDFDLDLAKKRSMENPVYYVQYAHARICSIAQKGVERGLVAGGELQSDAFVGKADLDAMMEGDIELVRHLNRFPDAVAGAAQELDTVRITNYLRALAQEFQSYYERGDGDERLRVLVEDEKVRRMRLAVIAAVKQVLQNGLSLLGVGAPSRM
jgi:arginyl-tRNA synthetase